MTEYQTNIIRRLQAEVERLRAENQWLADERLKWETAREEEYAEVRQLRAENEKQRSYLDFERANVERLRADLERRNQRTGGLEDKVERLRRGLSEIARHFGPIGELGDPSAYLAAQMAKEALEDEAV